MKLSNSKGKKCFIGVSLGGGKTDKASVAVIEHYTEGERTFLLRIFDKIKSEEELSSELKIFEIISQFANETESVAFDTPWQLPLCLNCTLPCPGFEVCKEDHIQWMWKFTKSDSIKKKKNKKLFTPYSQRCVEMYLSHNLETPWHMNVAMGANTAPLLARAAFLVRRLNLPVIEVFPQLSVWRVGRAIGTLKSKLKLTRKSAGGQDARKSFLDDLIENKFVFIYEQDRKIMIENNHAFEAFICAVTGLLKYKGLTEVRPKGFPKNESWIEFPVKELF